jgi:hypothetical protein
VLAPKAPKYDNVESKREDGEVGGPSPSFSAGFFFSWGLVLLLSVLMLFPSLLLLRFALSEGLPSPLCSDVGLLRDSCTDSLALLKAASADDQIPDIPFLLITIKFSETKTNQRLIEVFTGLLVNYT